MHHVFCFTLQTVRSALIPDHAPQDAPLVVLFDGCPSLDRLVQGICVTENSVKPEEMKAKLQKEGLTDNTLAQTMTLLATALAEGHWPTSENRMEDGSLMSFSLLQINRSKLIPTHLRRPNRAQKN